MPEGKSKISLNRSRVITGECSQEQICFTREQKNAFLLSLWFRDRYHRFNYELLGNSSGISCKSKLTVQNAVGYNLSLPMQAPLGCVISFALSSSP